MCQNSEDEEEDAFDPELHTSQRVAGFELDLLYEHSNHNSSQAYFTLIMGAASSNLYGDEVEETSAATEYHKVLNKWNRFVKHYKQRDCCMKCSFLYEPNSRQPSSCPHCGFERFDDKRQAHSVFRWWPLKEYFAQFFMTPDKAAMSQSWKDSFAEDDEEVVQIKGIYGTRTNPFQA